MDFLITKLSEVLAPDSILELDAPSKTDALEALNRSLWNKKQVLDGEAFLQALMQRERQASTGVGLGIAIPHVKIPEITDYVVAVGRSRKGIEFDALDGKPVHLIFMIGASDRHTREFVRILAQVTHLLKCGEIRTKLLEAEIPDEFLAVIRANER